MRATIMTLKATRATANAIFNNHRLLNLEDEDSDSDEVEITLF